MSHSSLQPGKRRRVIATHPVRSALGPLRKMRLPNVLGKDHPHASKA